MSAKNPLTSPDDPRHGTTSAYRNHRCRCDRCCAANTAACSDYNHRTGRTRPKEQYLKEIREEAEARRVHGIESTYSRGCRCRECVRASSEARKLRRWKNPRASAEYSRIYHATGGSWYRG